MSGVQEVSMADSHASKLAAVLKAIEALIARIGALENLASEVGISQGAKILQPMQHVAIEGPTPLPSQGNNCSNQNLGGGATNLKKPRISLSENFDGTQSKFQGFINQIRLITILQSKRYPIDQLRVGLVGILLTGQALSWFVPLFERAAFVLNNFEAFLVAFAEAFEDHDKARSTTTKICVLRQGSCPTSVYVLDFILLTCDVNWDKETLMSQFHWGLQDNVKDLLLSMFDPQIVNEAINQAVKYDNRLFQRCQDQHSWNSPKHSYSQLAASTSISNSHSRIEDMQYGINHSPHKRRSVVLMRACDCIVEKVRQLLKEATLPYFQNEERNYFK
jgi:hypothetical protein